MAKVGVELTMTAISGLFSIAKFGIKTVKNFPKIKEELADLDAVEIIGGITAIATKEVPELIAAIQEKAEV